MAQQLQDVSLKGESAGDELVKACRDGTLEEVKRQLASAGFKSIYDGLVEAFDKERRDVVKVIIAKEGIEDLQDSDGTLFVKLMDKRPDIASLLLDDCIGDGGKTITFNYKFLEERAHHHTDFPNDIDAERQSQSSESGCNEDQFHILERMDPESELLLHPVVKSLLSWKWSTYIAWFFFIILGLYLVFLSFLTAFALIVPNPQLRICTGNSSNDTEATDNGCDLSPHRRRFLILAEIVITVFSIVRLVVELLTVFNVLKLLQIITVNDCSKRSEKEASWIMWEYFLSTTPYVEVPMYILSIVFVAVGDFECLCPSPGQWQAGTVAVFLAWFDLLHFLNKWPPLGIYIGVLWKIMLTFLKVSIIALFLLLAFGFAFYMAFYEPPLPDTPFQNPIVTFVTMISFAISSPDISIFRLSNDNTKVDTIPYPLLSYLIWIIFGIIMSVLFLNFLVGLAVGDVNNLLKEGDKERVKSVILLFKSVERTLKILKTIGKVTDRCKCCLHLLNRMRSPHDRSRTVSTNSLYVKMAILWGDEIRTIICQARNLKKS